AICAQQHTILRTIGGARNRSPESSQDAPLNRPDLGFVSWSSPAELRGILGVPGASVFSNPLPLPETVTAIHLAPSHSFALIEHKDKQIGVMSLKAENFGREAVIGGAFTTADLVAFSPSSRSAILLSATAGRIQAITGLPNEPQVVQSFDVNVLPEPPTSVAIDDEATAVLFASGRAVYLVDRNGLTTVMGIAGEA